MAFDRVTIDPDRMARVPRLHGVRVPVETVVRMLAQGMTDQEIVVDYPYREVDGIRPSLAGSELRKSPK
jgi:uncharacterized protein (DUF433 family)